MWVKVGKTNADRAWEINNTLTKVDKEERIEELLDALDEIKFLSNFDDTEMLKDIWAIAEKITNKNA